MNDPGADPIPFWLSLTLSTLSLSFSFSFSPNPIHHSISLQTTPPNSNASSFLFQSLLLLLFHAFASPYLNSFSLNLSLSHRAKAKPQPRIYLKQKPHSLGWRGWIIQRLHHRRRQEMEGVPHPVPRTVEEVFTDFKGRRSGLIKALTTGTLLSFSPFFLLFSLLLHLS